MKKNLFTICLTLMISLVSIAAYAQNENEKTSFPVPKWVSEKGYWIVESNIHTPRINTIYFYNNQNVLVYKENVNGVVLKVRKKSVKMNLKKVLDQSVIAFNERQKATENEMLVINLIRKK